MDANLRLYLLPNSLLGLEVMGKCKSRDRCSFPRWWSSWSPRSASNL